MQIKWKEQQSTIVGFGVILLVLGVFSYVIWTTGKASRDEMVIEEVPLGESPEVANKTSSEETKLPEYPITKVDTTGWEFRETTLGNVGIRYKVMNKDLDNRSGDSNLFLDPHFDLKEYGINKLIISADNNRAGKGYDEISINDCVNCGGGPYDPAPGRMRIDIVENSELNLSDIKNILLNQTCNYIIVPNEGMSPYTLNEKCSTDQQFISYNYSSKGRESQKIGDIINLRASGKEIIEYKNPFVTSDLASVLIKYPIAMGAQDLSTNNIEDPEIVFNDQIVFIVDLGDRVFALITYQLANDESDNMEVEQKINNIMHTILSTIEVI